MVNVLIFTDFMWYSRRLFQGACFPSLNRFSEIDRCSLSRTNTDLPPCTYVYSYVPMDRKFHDMLLVGLPPAVVRQKMAMVRGAATVFGVIKRRMA